MTRPKFFGSDISSIRKALQQIVEVADQVHASEDQLIQLLYKIDQERIYVRVGYKSLRAFCIDGLKFGRTQSQRIVTRVRRLVPTVNIRPEDPRWH
jgi:hypothetical protein